MALPPDLQQQYDAYMADTSKGIPISLLQYAQANPGAGIDTSGNGLKTTDPMYNFYNPLPGQTPGVNWFYADDRNNANLNNPQPTTATPSNISQLSSTAAAPSPTGGGLQTVSGGAPTPSAGRSLYNPTGTPTAATGARPLPPPPVGGYTTAPATGSTGMPTQAPVPYQGGLGNPTGPSAPSTPAPGAPASPYDFSSVMAQYGLNQPLTNSVLPALQDILNRMNTGLSPQVLSAMRSQATSTIPGQYDQAAQALRSQLLRSGAIGAGELPPDAAGLIRNFAPLEQARNQAIASANQNTILANQNEIARNQGLGMTAIGDVLNAQQLANQYNLGTAANDTQRWVASLQSDTQKWVSQLSSDTQKQLAELQATTNIDINKLDNDTKLKIAQLETAPGSLRNVLLAGLFSTLTAGAGTTGSAVNSAIGALGKIFRGGGTTATTQVGGTMDPNNPDWQGPVGGGPATAAGAAGGIGGAISTVASGVGSAISGVASGVASAASKAVGFLMSNPITLAIGGAIAGVTLFLKSQAHWEANTWVQKYQNPFDQQMDSINQQFAQLKNSGQLTRQNGQAIIDAATNMIQTYEAQRQKFSTQGGDENTVAGQALSTFNYWYGPNGSKYLGQMQDAINALPATAA